MIKYINKNQVTCVDLCEKGNGCWELFINLTSGKFERTQGSYKRMTEILEELASAANTGRRLVNINGD